MISYTVCTTKHNKEYAEEYYKCKMKLTNKTIGKR